jgi:hypothetical protein
MAFAAQFAVVVQADVLGEELHVWLAANSNGEALVAMRASRRRAAGVLAEARDFMGTSGVFINLNVRKLGLSCA